jgi:hydrogenase/urease accessory protein HupE
MKAILLWFLLVVAAQAHPVAQGSLELDVRPTEIHARVRVSNEQVFVQAAHSDAATLEQAWPAHGAYVLSKMEVTADGRVLTGAVEKVEPPADHSTRGFAIYELRYPLTSPPHELKLQQSLMNEISYAPGNPWEATLVVRITAAGRLVSDGALFTHREPFVVSLDAATAPPGIFGTYLRHGIFHILEGWDHLLFMAALVLATRRIGELLAVVTAFTVAHTVTLTLSVLNIVRLSPSIVEPMIALSIVVVALQNVFRPETARGWLRLGLAFGFGLFHGLGFAGGLLEAMQANASVLQPLVAFSLGVELGHQVVVLPIFALLWFLRARSASPEFRERRLQWVLRLGSCAIALAGGFYLVAALRG